ncbi:MAG: hypothetical protein RL754_738 [Bacteroidota bacterium]
MIRIAILASGSGSNAQKLVEYFAQNDLARVELILTNNPHAGVIQRAENLGVKCVSFDSKAQNEEILTILQNEADVVLLAGYLKMIPASWVHSFNGKMLNIHPALLPKFGGKGMYGANVHKAVSEAGEVESGITIHLVNEHYDEGAIVAQYIVDIEPFEDPESIEAKVRELEIDYYAPTVEAWLEQLITSN